MMSQIINFLWYTQSSAEVVQRLKQCCGLRDQWVCAYGCNCVVQENVRLERDLRRQHEIVDRWNLAIESLLRERAALSRDSEEVKTCTNTLMRCIDAEVHIPLRELSRVSIHPNVDRATSFGYRFFEQLVAGVLLSSPFNFTLAQLFSYLGVAALTARVCLLLMQKRRGIFACSALSVLAR